MTLRNMLLPTKFGHSWSNRTSVIMEIRQKNMTLVSRLSRSLKVIIYTDQSATYDFLFVFYIKCNIYQILPPTYI